MIRPKRFKGFGGVATPPPPHLDEKAFCQMCYFIAMENGGTVTELDTDTYPRNFYSAKLSRYDQSVFLLQNIHYPYAAFAQRDADGRFIFTGPPEWLRLPEGTVRFLSLAELNQNWRGLCGERNQGELEQSRYWNAQTVGAIIFNAWD